MTDKLKRLKKWKELFARATKSKFATDAFWVFLFSVCSKAFLFFGTAYAAKCLGPTNLGISAQIQALAQQLALTFNGGFDSVAVRIIADDKSTAARTLNVIVLFRLGIALLLAAAWLVAIIYIHEPGPMRTAWMLGAPLLVIASLNTTFIYQAIEKLPLQTAILSAGTVITAFIYLFFFTPGIVVGADLMAATIVSALTVLFALGCCYKLLACDRQRLIVWQPVVVWQDIKKLLAQGWRYWLLAIVVYLYAGFPILLIAYFHGDSAAGMFRAAFLMAGALELLFGSINNLLLPKLVKWNKAGTSLLWMKQSELLPLHLFIGIGAGAIAILSAPYVFERFLGSQFLGATKVFQILIVGRVVVFIGQIYAWGLVALHLDSMFLWVSLAGAIISVVLNVLLIPQFGLVGSAIVSVSVETLICTSCYLMERQYVFKNS